MVLSTLRLYGSSSGNISTILRVVNCTLSPLLSRACFWTVACGRNPSMRDTTDSYRNSVKNGYYSSSIIEKRDKDGNFIGFAYNKPGE